MGGGSGPPRHDGAHATLAPPACLRQSSRVPIVRNAAGRLCVELGDGAGFEAVRGTLIDAFAASSGPSSVPTGAHDAWHELSIDGRRFRLEWNRWSGCRIVCEDPRGHGTLRKIALWFQEDREAW